MPGCSKIDRNHAFTGSVPYSSYVREADGLAKAAVTGGLQPTNEKMLLPFPRHSLKSVENCIPEMRVNCLKQAREKLDAAHFKTDYISIARASDLQPIADWNGKEKAVALIAAFQGEVRLIDNMLLN